MLILFLVFIFLRISHCYIGLTRSSLYEENETISIAWKNENIPLNLRLYFKFEGKKLMVSPPNGFSFEFVIARKADINDNFVVQWCAPSAEEYAKCDNDIMFVGNSYNDTWDSQYNCQTCSKKFTASGLYRRNYETSFLVSKDHHFFKNISEPLMCHRIIAENHMDSNLHIGQNLINGKWETVMEFDGYTGGLQYIPLPGHPKYHQSGRMLNGDFCGKPFFFPDTGVVFQKAIRKIGNEYEIIESLTAELSSNVSNTTDDLELKQLPNIDYLIPAIFGGICTGLLFCALICLIAFLLIQRNRKERFNGRPSFSLESFDDSTSAPINDTEADAPPSSKREYIKNDNDSGYSKLLKSEFENSDTVLPVQSFDSKTHSIIQFLTQEFDNDEIQKSPKSADKLVEEALEEPFAENRTLKLLQVVIKANNELYSLGYCNRIVHSSKFHLSAPPNSSEWLRNLKKDGDFLRFIVSVSEKEIGGKYGEFEEDSKLWRLFLEKIDASECFRQSCLFGQTLQRRQFFVMATFYKIATLIAENSDQKALLSMKYPIPLFINLCEKYPHYFEIH